MAIDRHKLNSKFRSEENLPEEFSWENINQGIYEKMNSNKSRRPAGIVFISAIALALLIMGGGVFIYLYNKNHSELNTIAHNANKKSNGSEYKKSDVIQPVAENINNEAIKTESIKVEKTFSVNNENGTTELTITKEIKTKRTYGDNKLANSINKNSSNTSNKKLDKNDKIESSTNAQSFVNEVNLIKEKSAPDSENTSVKTNEVKSPNDNSLVDSKNLNASEIVIAVIESKYHLIFSNTKPILPLIEIINPTIKKKEKNELKNSISINGGLLSSFSNYGSTPIDALKSKYEKEALGYSFGIGYHRVLSNKISLNTGFDYNTMRSILDYKETTSYLEQRDNLLLSMDINTITGDTVKTYGTGIVTGKQTRTVLHYNTQRVLSIPVLLSYMIQNKKFHYTIGLGPVVHYNLSAKGRTIVDTDQFLTYDKNYFNTLNYGLLARLGVKYSLGERYLIGLDVSFSAPLGKWNIDSSFSLKRSMPGSHLSIAYRF